MKHTIEYNGERKTVEAKRTATIAEVAEIAFGYLPSTEYSKIICHGSGKHADKYVSHLTGLSTRYPDGTNGRTVEGGR